MIAWLILAIDYLILVYMASAAVKPYVAENVAVAWQYCWHASQPFPVSQATKNRSAVSLIELMDAAPLMAKCARWSV